jgi:predicted metalloprotease with PDZ domain
MKFIILERKTRVGVLAFFLLILPILNSFCLKESLASETVGQSNGAIDAEHVIERAAVTVNGLSINLVLQGANIVALKEEIIHVTKASFDYYIKLFGGLPKQTMGEKFTHLSIEVKQSEEWNGEAYAKHLELTFDPKPDSFDQFRWKGIVAHEIFHLWNSKSFRYSSGREQWFNEGISQYYALKALKQMNVINEEWFFWALGKFLQLYFADNGTGRISMREAGLDKKQHTGLVEGGGLWIGVCLDAMVRNATKNEKSLDDLMQTLFKKYNSTDKLYDLKEIMKIARQLTGDANDDFFKKYANGTERLSATQYLSKAGLTLEMNSDSSQIEIRKKNNIGELEQRTLSGILGNLNE